MTSENGALGDTWDETAEDDFGGEYVNFKDGKIHRIQFVGNPIRETFRPAGEDKNVLSYSFPVMEGGEAIFASVTSKRLMKILIELQREGKLMGKTYDITPVGEGMGKQWIVQEVFL